MTLQRMRSAAAALALAGILCAAPAYAAQWEGPILFPVRFESALEWISRLWLGTRPRSQEPWRNPATKSTLMAAQSRQP